MACHYDIYQTYVQTGMGQSMSLATPENSEAIFTENSILTDTFNNFRYQPYWKDSVLKLKELHDYGERIEDVDFIVGSGHHTNSHLWEEGGYVHQMPLPIIPKMVIWISLRVLKMDTIAVSLGK